MAEAAQLHRIAPITFPKVATKQRLNQLHFLLLPLHMALKNSSRSGQWNCALHMVMFTEDIVGHNVALVRF